MTTKLEKTKKTGASRYETLDGRFRIVKVTLGWDLFDTTIADGRYDGGWLQRHRTKRDCLDSIAWIRENEEG